MNHDSKKVIQCSRITQVDVVTVMNYPALRVRVHLQNADPVELPEIKIGPFDTASRRAELPKINQYLIIYEDGEKVVSDMALAVVPAMPEINEIKYSNSEAMLAGIFERYAAPRTDMLPTKVFLSALEGRIVNKAFEIRPDGRTTMCELTMENGTTVQGFSVCACIEEFIQVFGENASYTDALTKAWAFEGYLLKELRFRAGLK